MNSFWALAGFLATTFLWSRFAAIDEDESSLSESSIQSYLSHLPDRPRRFNEELDTNEESDEETSEEGDYDSDDESDEEEEREEESDESEEEFNHTVNNSRVKKNVKKSNKNNNNNQNRNNNNNQNRINNNNQNRNNNRNDNNTGTNSADRDELVNQLNNMFRREYPEGSPAIDFETHPFEEFIKHVESQRKAFPSMIYDSQNEEETVSTLCRCFRLEVLLAGAFPTRLLLHFFEELLSCSRHSASWEQSTLDVLSHGVPLNEVVSLLVSKGKLTYDNLEPLIRLLDPALKQMDLETPQFIQQAFGELLSERELEEVCESFWLNKLAED